MTTPDGDGQQVTVQVQMATQAITIVPAGTDPGTTVGAVVPAGDPGEG